MLWCKGIIYVSFSQLIFSNLWCTFAPYQSKIVSATMKIIQYNQASSPGMFKTVCQTQTSHNIHTPDCLISWKKLNASDVSDLNVQRQ